MEKDFESDSLELDLFFENSDPLGVANENEKSPVVPRGNLPRRNASSPIPKPPSAKKGPCFYKPHVSETTHKRQLPLVTPLHVEPPYKLAPFHEYPNVEKDITADTVYNHIVSDLNKILNTSNR